MSIENKKLTVGFITYGKSTAKYLPYFLNSLENQTFSNFKIIAVDNSEIEDENTQHIKSSRMNIEIIRFEENVGFARAYNKMINRSVESGDKYFLALNPDMIFEPDMIEKLLIAIERDKKICAVQPKILKWNFEKREKTNIVDSLGLEITRDHCFFDRDSGCVDANKPSKEIFGFTGAAVLWRIESLRDVVFENEYFDELMFMYKEDCDLSYRLRLAGWKIVLAPEAIAYHDRTASTKGENIFHVIKNRKNKSKLVKKWSFLNQWIIVLKYKNLPFSAGVKIATWWYQFKSLVFVLFFEQYLLEEFLKLWSIRKKIKEKRDNLKVRTDVGDIEKLMK